MVILSAKHLSYLQQHYNEYKDVRNQDGEGPYCNYVITDHTKKKAHFYTLFPGSSGGLCRKVVPTIPHKLWFASRHELSRKQKHYDNILHTVQAYQGAWDTDTVEYEIMDGKACMNAIIKSPITGASSALIKFYKQDQSTIFDICRAVILQQYGGYFFNEEVEVVEPYLAKNDINFVGVLNPSGLFLTHFVASAKKHPVMHEIITKYVMLAEGTLSLATPNQSGDIYRDSYNAKINHSISKSVLLLEKHLTVMAEIHDVKARDSRSMCNFIITDPELETINFYTRMYTDGRYCVDVEN